MAAQTTLDAILSLSKRKGFVYQSSEIYGGLNGCYDFGPLGVELLRNIKDSWWKAMTFRTDIVGIDSSILMHPRVWEASGHVGQFSDPMIDNKTSKSRHRADNLIEEFAARLRSKGKTDQATIIENALNAATTNEDLHAIIIGNNIPDPISGTTDWTEVRNFNLMFETHVGPVADASSTVYLRPETAQGIFVNFKNVMDSARMKPPFGIAQIGKSFRNEINTKNFLFRVREFEQMEMQFFIKPGTENEWFEYWRQARWDWFVNSIGINPEHLHRKPHEKLAHYAAAAEDIEYLFPFGWGEVEGIHSRTDFDLQRHQEFSGKKLEYVDTVSKDRYTPFVIETAVGATRTFLAVLCDAYAEEEVPTADGGSETRSVMRLKPSLAPMTAAVLPLVNKDGMPEAGEEIMRNLQRSFRVEFDTSGAIGRRYRRQDEVGTPFCITVDGQTITDSTVTLRERDSMQQVRVHTDTLTEEIRRRLEE
ncbi:MAG: glycine--tRNA ligase [Candidatus Kapabacteria bacterium]|nr:glycine--tRNA ligase [Ignavibacteria bacterium]MBL0322832.1 glycine--tRNA ligase [Ignavibacteria bacterium]MBP6509949.1 glycine--tRNA ligase [Candidatus Kapabacteria bacterium]